MYRIERQDQLYKTLPQALFFSPTIVIFSALTLLLPLSGVFAPSSLTVITKNFTHVENCIIPTGNLLTADTPDYTSLYTYDMPSINEKIWSAPTTRAEVLTTQWFVEQRIPYLPQACGPSCRYKVQIPSFVFQCTPNPSSLPYGQGGDPMGGATLWNGTTYIVGGTTLWNGTRADEDHPNSNMGFYIAWKSNGLNGTSGNAVCSPVGAQYDVEVRIIAHLPLIFLTIDFRSRRKKVSNLLRQTSRK